VSHEPIWVTVDEAVALNKLILADTGEPAAVIDAGKLDGAVARPKQIFAYQTDDVLVMAVGLCIGICRAHAFMQGNKRTGWEAMLLFLANNGFQLDPPNDPAFADALVGVIGDTISEEILIRLLEPHLSQVDD